MRPGLKLGSAEAWHVQVCSTAMVKPSLLGSEVGGRCDAGVQARAPRAEVVSGHAFVMALVPSGVEVHIFSLMRHFHGVAHTGSVTSALALPRETRGEDTKALVMDTTIAHNGFWECRSRRRMTKGSRIDWSRSLTVRGDGRLIPEFIAELNYRIGESEMSGKASLVALVSRVRSLSSATSAKVASEGIGGEGDSPISSDVSLCCEHFETDRQMADHHNIASSRSHHPGSLDPSREPAWPDAECLVAANKNGDGDDVVTRASRLSASPTLCCPLPVIPSAYPGPSRVSGSAMQGPLYCAAVCWAVLGCLVLSCRVHHIGINHEGPRDLIGNGRPRPFPASRRFPRPAHGIGHGSPNHASRRAATSCLPCARVRARWDGTRRVRRLCLACHV